MKKKLTRILFIIFLLLLIVYMITSSKTVIESVSFSISIWKDNLFPILFPFFVISNLLIYYDFIDIIGHFFEKPMSKLFHLPKESAFVLIISMFSGFPSGAKYTKDLVSKKLITKEEASRLLTFTHYSNPLFIVGMIGTLLLANQQLAFLILISHISSGILIGYLYNRKYKNVILAIKKESVSKKDKLSFPEVFTKTIVDSLNTLFLLLGIVTIFLVVNSFLTSLFSFTPVIQAIFSGILEMTQGVKLVSLLNVSELLKTILITFIISFGGLSVHMQVLGIISEEKIKYSPFLIARICHAILASGIVFILYFIMIP